ncbi:DsbA family protein [Nitrosopumilus maritimus]|uniref:DSBA oxidoreductase n=1 Tax=Nitrosopumilus maritimus (strain SCM1) TaxID=436308 RepID=A9A3A6_NITMS|nr:DsbA family protein [Nitrosopumilus maritimus]ABX12535.1 DSBA oxidoreductase [Nitrosopumilus maritimus SCM1]
MNKKGVIIGVVAIAIIAGVAASLSATPAETVNLDMTRTHGTISTAMGSPILGDPNAPITIVEFGDYQCHQCYNWFHNTKPTITRDYIDTGKANLVFVDMAFLGRDSSPAAQATYCAEDQGMYWEYHDMLYNAQESKIDGGWANNERLKAFAFSMGLDMELFESCLDSGKYSKRVQYNTQQARDHNVRGTPGFFIVGPDGQQQIGGAQPFSVFKQVLDPMV